MTSSPRDYLLMIYRVHWHTIAQQKKQVNWLPFIDAIALTFDICSFDLFARKKRPSRYVRCSTLEFYIMCVFSAPSTSKIDSMPREWDRFCFKYYLIDANRMKGSNGRCVRISKAFETAQNCWVLMSVSITSIVIQFGSWSAVLTSITWQVP